MTKQVRFFGPFNKNGFLSNFYMSSFRDKNGILYSCSEQYYMKKKQETFDKDNTILANKIMSENSPKKIKQLGKTVCNFECDVWDIYKKDFMLEALYYKFSQNEKLKELLISTQDALIVETSPFDFEWGTGNGSGQNLMGVCLMETRQKLKNKKFKFHIYMNDFVFVCLGDSNEIKAIFDNEKAAGDFCYQFDCYYCQHEVNQDF